MFVYLVLLVGLISYIAYFQLIQVPKIAEMDSNSAVMAAQNEVIRGEIKDRDGNVLAKSTKSGDLTQKENILMEKYILIQLDMLVEYMEMQD